MCYYINAVLPSSSDVQKAHAIAEQFGRVLRPIATGAIVDQLRDGETIYLTTPGHCDCGTVLGRARRGEPARDNKLQRLRRKGWSESKIKRWLADTEDADKRRRRPSDLSWIDAGQWLELLRAIVSSGATRKIGLLLHWDSDSIADPDFTITREQVSLSETDQDFLLRINEDCLYEFSI